MARSAPVVLSDHAYKSNLSNNHQEILRGQVLLFTSPGGCVACLGPLGKVAVTEKELKPGVLLFLGSRVGA